MYFSKGDFKWAETTSMAEGATSRDPAGVELVRGKESNFPGITNEDSYLDINDNVPCFVEKDSYNNKTTQMGESIH